MPKKTILEKPKGQANLVRKPWDKSFEDWADKVGNENLIVRLYNKNSYYNEHIESDFIYRLGIDASQFHYHSKIINAGYVSEALELKRRINYVIERDNPINHLIDLHLQSYSDNSLQTYSDMRRDLV